MSSDDLRGKAYLASFIFTSCTDVCPMMTMEMAKVQRELREAGLLGSKVLLVSFSFDPERDTPETLRKYADSYQADPDAWLFLTGSKEQVREVVERGFRVFYEEKEAAHDSLGEAYSHDSHEEHAVEFSHANVFVLVDGEGVIRQTYTTSVLDVPKVVEAFKKVTQ